MHVDGESDPASEQTRLLNAASVDIHRVDCQLNLQQGDSN